MSVQPPIPVSEEIWKPVPGYEGYYDISNAGRVRRSFDAPPMKSTKPGRVLMHDISTGYARVSLSVGNGCRKFLVHRLMMMVFVGDGMNRQHVNHKDGNKLNNDLSNLEWCTPRENVIHAWRTGLAKAKLCQDSPKAKLKEPEVERIFEAVGRGVPQRHIASVFGVTESQISAIVCGRTNWNYLIPQNG